MTSRLRLGPAIQKRALLVFILAVVLPAVALTILGLRTIIQEQRSGEAWAREYLQAAADRISRKLSEELEWWQDRVDELPSSGRLDAADFPGRMREALDIPGAAILLVITPADIQAIPRGQLLYQVRGIADPAAAPAILEPVEELERRGDHALALQNYRRLLADNKDPALQPWLLQRVGRSARNAGLREEALTAYRTLARSAKGMIGSVPAELVASEGICTLLEESGSKELMAAAAADFHRLLTGGRWQLDKPRYVDYSARARRWIEQFLPKEVRLRLTTIEDQKLVLAEAVEALLASMNSTSDSSANQHAVFRSAQGLHLAFWRKRFPAGRAICLVFSADYTKNNLLPRLFNTPPAQDVGLALFSPEGLRIFASQEPPAPQVADSLLILPIRAHDYTWRLESWLRQPELMQAEIRRRQWLYLGMFALMLASLIVGIITSARTLRKQLEIARMKSDFVSAVSHEFLSPLTGIRQLAEMLESDRVPNEERKKQYYNRILRESQRLSALVANVLSFARAEEKCNQYRFEVVETSSWLLEIVRRFQQSPAAGDHEIVAEICRELPPLLADRDALATALTNLLDNAVKYSPECKTVRIEAELKGQQVVIRVCDRGIGISREDQEHVFERFYRGRSDFARGMHGAGLGLSLVKEIIDAHQGEIKLESTPGAGSTISILLKQPVAASG